ncbi:SPOR domain-containing protein [Nitratireductor sp. GISD-1A_MAKvit]|uniref:SPOR domain-containing protein n=1 Tax=Nitratireductor sp. GISD-1A_MAKvit TaxID=3234198 RepID=UPI003467240A
MGARGLSAGDDLVETYDHGFAASLEEELSAGASAAEEVADDAMEPHRDAKSDSEFSWDPFDGSSSPDSTGSESAQAETGDSIPFWRETEQSSPSLRGGEKDTPPIVDTVSVPGNERVQVEDANHIPEFVSEPERFPEAEPDDLERALARAFGDNESLPEPEPEPLRRDDEPSSSLPNDAYATAALGARGTDAEDYDFDAAFSDDFGAPDGFNPPGVSGTTMLEPGRDDPQFVATDNPAWENGSLETESDAEPFAGDADVVAPTRRSRGGSGRTTLIAGALGGVAVLGLLGFFALGGSGEDGSAPVVVRADDGPVKVKPENPGGQQVPNQDNQVYQRVSGSEAGNNPVQERLVSTAEEPVEVPKSEERLASNTNGSATPTSEPVTAMQPRRVRTMVVRPDGTIVPREPVETPVANADTARDPAAGGSQVANVNSPQAVNTTSPDARLRGTAENVAPTVESGTSEAGVPQTAPVPATRPSPPPVQRQPQPAADPAPAARVASAPSQPAQPAAQPQPPAAAPVTSGGGDGWSVQISSQPTVDAAQKSYQDMARRYGSLLTGKGVNIVKADIAGKGTYYRVRIPSSSKDEAIRLCSQLKSAGGSCFVSK